MCKIVKEGIAFPFPDLSGTLPPDGVMGDLVIHVNGTWTFETIDDREALSYFVHYPEGSGNPVVDVEYYWEVSEGMTSQ